MITADLHHGLRRIARDLADGRLTARALLEATQARHDPGLEAYKTWAPDFARRQADAADAARAAGVSTGGLQGIPVSFKDLYGVAGLPLFAGSPAELPAEWRREGPLVQSLRRQLAVITGKTHTVEFAFGALGLNAHWPVPRNPRDLDVHRAPGGSSSGAGVSVVEGTALIAFGTDTGGSVRVPASFTGTVGLKTTRGRWSTDGIVPLSPTFDTPGILARSASDTAYAFEHIDGQPVPVDAPLGGLRIGVAERFFLDETSPGIAERVTEATAAIEAAGARLSPLELPGCAEVFELYFKGGIVAAELYQLLRSHLPERLDTLDPFVRRRLDAGKDLEAWEYLHRRARYQSLARTAAEAMREVDVLVCPTVPITPPPVDELKDELEYARCNMLALRNTCVPSFLGLCAVTLPTGLDAAGMPVGLQLIAGPGDEARLLAIACAIEHRLARVGLWCPPTDPD